MGVVLVPVKPRREVGLIEEAERQLSFQVKRTEEVHRLLQTLTVGDVQERIGVVARIIIGAGAQRYTIVSIELTIRCGPDHIPQRYIVGALITVSELHVHTKGQELGNFGFDIHTGTEGLVFLTYGKAFVLEVSQGSVVAEFILLAADGDRVVLTFRLAVIHFIFPVNDIAGLVVLDLHRRKPQPVQPDIHRIARSIGQGLPLINGQTGWQFTGIGELIFDIGPGGRIKTPHTPKHIGSPVQEFLRTQQTGILGDLVHVVVCIHGDLRLS